MIGRALTEKAVTQVESWKSWPPMLGPRGNVGRGNARRRCLQDFTNSRSTRIAFPEPNTLAPQKSLHRQVPPVGVTGFMVWNQNALVESQNHFLVLVVR